MPARLTSSSNRIRTSLAVFVSLLLLAFVPGPSASGKPSPSPQAPSPKGEPEQTQETPQSSSSDAAPSRKAAPRDPAIAIAERVAPGQMVEIDGDLSEWEIEQLPSNRRLRLDKPGQILAPRDRRWDGVDDLSATFVISYDPSSLYLVGSLQDEALLHENPRPWWHGDSIEVFFDFHAKDSTATRRSALEENTDLGYYQLFFMPVNALRPWGVWQRGPTVLQSSNVFDGVTIAWRPHETGYDFEAQIPRSNFPELDLEAGRQVRFNIAVNDFDPQEPTDNEHVYMVWTGRESPVRDRDLYGILRFENPFAEQTTPPSDFSTGPQRILLIGVFLAGLVVLGLLVSRLAPKVAALSQRRKLSIAAVLFTSLLLVWTIPLLSRQIEEANARREFAGTVSELSEILAEVRDEKLIALGAPSDPTYGEALLKLLRGERVPISKSYRYTSVSLGPEHDPPLSQTKEGVPFLDRRHREILFHEPSPRGMPFAIGTQDADLEEIYLVYRILHPESISLEGDFDRPPPQLPLDQAVDFANRGGRTRVGTFEIQYSTTIPSRIPIELGVNADPTDLEDTRHRFPNWSEEVRVASSTRSVSETGKLLVNHWDQYRFRIPEEKRGLTVERVVYRHESTSVTLALAGITAKLTGNSGYRPVPFARTTRTNVPVTFFQWPPNPRQGVSPPPGGVKNIPIDQAAEVVWLLYTSEYRDTAEDPPRTGVEVGAFLLGRRDKGSKTIPLIFGESIDDSFWGELGDAPQKPLLDRAWIDRNIPRYLISEHPLGSPQELTSLAIRDNGENCGITLSALVLGNSAREEAARIGRLHRIESPSPGLLTLPVDTLERLDNVDFDIVRDPLLTITPTARSGDFRPREERNDNGLLLRHFLPVHPNARPELLLAIDQTTKPLWSMGGILPWLRSFLAAALLPLVLVLVTDLLEFLRRLRLKLVFTFILVAVLPLFALFLILNERTKVQLRNQVFEETSSSLQELQTQFDILVKRLDASTDEIFRTCIQADQEALQDPEEVEALLHRMRERWFPEQPEAYLLLKRTSPEGDATRGDQGRRRSSYREATFLSPAPPTGYTSYPLALGGGPDGLTVDGGDLLIVGSRDNRTPGKPTWSEVRVVYPITESSLEVIASNIERDAEISLYSNRGIPLLTSGRADRATEGTRDRIDRTREILGDILLTGKPQIEERNLGNLPFEVHSDALRAKDGSPLAVLSVASSTQGLRSLTSVLERTVMFFGSAIFLLVIVVGSVLTQRITEPVETLEKATGEVRHGNLAVEVSEGPNDEVGHLSRAFNSMTRDLRNRLREMQELNRGTREISTSLRKDRILEIAGQLIQSIARPDALLFLALDEEEESYSLLGGFRDGRILHPLSIPRTPGLIADGLESDAPICIENLPATLDAHPGPLSPEEHELFEGVDRGVLLPLASPQATSGEILLLYRPRQSDTPGAPAFPPNLELLSTLTTHVAAALENAKLYQLAIQDHATGFFVATYFESRLKEEIDRSHGTGRELSLIRLEIPGLPSLPARVGPDAFQRYLRELGGAVRRRLRRMYLVSKLGEAEFAVLMPETSRAAAQEAAQGIVQVVTREGISSGPGKKKTRLPANFGIACSPSDATSTAFLLDAARKALESDRSHEQDGVSSSVPIDSPAKPSPAPEIEELIASTCFRNEKCLEILETIVRIAPSSVTVLVQGETGAGKEIIADLIHQRSDRHDKPLVKINCTALPEPLLESELFGHEKGAFTGATQRKLGRFEIANGGTLFLDEIGDMSPAIQAKLLRVLQDKKIERLGGVEPVEIDVRIVAATHKDLISAIAHGSFREDLYFRLNVISLAIPPLRERKEEIPVLTEVFLEEFNEKNGTRVEGISPEALDKLHRHPWSGNVRELRNCLERAVLLGRTGPLLPEHISLLESGSESETPSSRPRRTAPASQASPAGRPLSQETLEVGEEHDLNPRQLQALEYLKSHTSLTNSDYARLLEISERTALRDLADLVAKKLLTKRGRTRGTAYFLP